jgi:hypothetical protein
MTSVSPPSRKKQTTKKMLTESHRMFPESHRMFSESLKCHTGDDQRFPSFAQETDDQEKRPQFETRAQSQ